MGVGEALSSGRPAADTFPVTDVSGGNAGSKTGAISSMNWAGRPASRGVDLPTSWVLGIAVAMYVAVNVVTWQVAGPAFTYVSWIYEPSIDGVTRQTLVPSLVDAAMWLVIVTALGWRRAVGFGGGVMSLWGIVPVVIFCPMLFVGVADPSIAERGLPFLGVALAAVLVAAFVEEVAFRGFLLHGLSVRLGGVTAVGLSSVLFALAHLPTMLGTGQRFVVPMLALHFGSAVLYARIRCSTDSIWYATAVHAFMNMLTFLFASWGPETGSGVAAFTVLKFGAILIGVASWFMLVAANERRPVPGTQPRLTVQDAWVDATSGADQLEK